MQKKILVLVSNPKGTTSLELLPEINKLEEALRRSTSFTKFLPSAAQILVTLDDHLQQGKRI